jgi:hypothetical protein
MQYHRYFDALTYTRAVTISDATRRRGIDCNRHAMHSRTDTTCASNHRDYASCKTSLAASTEQ